MNCIRAVDPEELEKSCAKYVFKVAKLANAVAGASSNIMRQCKPEIKVSPSVNYTIHCVLVIARHICLCLMGQV